MAFQKPKGTADILPENSSKWQYVEKTAREIFNNYRYREIRTPMFEDYQVFSRSSGDTSDIVTKEMYDFKDKGDRHIALRPEGTAGVVRAFVENKLYGPEHFKPEKVYYMGPMFRYERPQSGRQRQFHQIGVEAFGSESPDLDVEVIALGINLLNNLGMKNLKLVINSLGDVQTREAYHDALVNYLRPHFDELSEDSQTRLEKNPLRVLDSKDKKDQEIVKNAPSILDYLDDESKAHFEKVKIGLDALNIPYEIDSDMVRGLDYYNHTIFEIMSDSKAFGGNFMTVLAGGRYDGLVEELNGPHTPGVGFGMGMERIMLVMDAENVEIPNADELDVYVVGIGEESDLESLRQVQALREQNISADRDYLDKKAKGQFKQADRLKAQFVITLGESELESKSAQVKNMHNGQQTSVPFEEIYHEFKSVMEKLA